MAPETEADDRTSPARVWLLPLSILAVTSLVVFLITYWIDAYSDPNPRHALGLFFDPNPESAANTLSNAGEIVAAVLAIAITVVAIVVELAANRYTHRITELFVSTPVNFYVTGFFVVTALQSLWVTLIFDYDPATGTGFVPHVGITVSMVMLTGCLLILLPYFGFVFSFLNPIQIVQRIQQQTLRFIVRQRGSIRRIQSDAVSGVEQVADVGLNAMENKDKGVSMASVEALQNLVIDYQEVRGGLPEGWFQVEGELAHNPDFVSMSPEVLADVSRRKIWFEMKVMRQYQTIYTEALNRMRDINYLIAISTRRVAEAAIRSESKELLDLSLKFFNTFLRATINARDVRTAYNVLNQYRLLAESALEYQGGSRSSEIARYFKYYGLAAYHANLPFILETVAYDLCSLNELAFDRKSDARRDILRTFLEVDKESEGEVQENSLRGVRKAQVKLATHYLLHGDEKLARQVYRDMADEDPTRLTSIRDELLNVRTAEFWEISDRGVNFDYLSPDRKAKMLEYFDWFGDILPARASQLPTPREEMPLVPADAVAPEQIGLGAAMTGVPGVPDERLSQETLEDPSAPPEAGPGAD
ncbi:MAG: DUF2254 domain-containing protein [Deltaproteobacteria bacterium]|nr:DUF2254 domain-containing protein [Deltaproteobacteria bacterium]